MCRAFCSCLGLLIALIFSMNAIAQCDPYVLPTSAELENLNHYVFDDLITSDISDHDEAKLKQLGFSHAEYYAFLSYMGGSFDKIKNAVINHQSGIRCTQAKMLVTGASKLKPYIGTVYRGEDEEFAFVSAHQNETFYVPSFLSTSKSRHVAETFIYYYRKPMELYLKPLVLAQIEVDHDCYDLAPLYELSVIAMVGLNDKILPGIGADEQEVLCTPNKLFQVTQVHNNAYKLSKIFGLTYNDSDWIALKTYQKNYLMNKDVRVVYATQILKAN